MRISPQKARLVVNLIRGHKANDAIITLRSVNKRIAPAVEKVLHSAIANAQNLNEERGCGRPDRFRSLRERRPAPAACASGSDGPRLPVSAAHGAHRGEGGGKGCCQCGEGITNGSESSSLRLPAGFQQAVAVALVLQTELCHAAAGRPGAEGRPARAAEVRRHQFDRSGPPRQQAARYHPHLASRYHHRTQGR